MTDRQTILERIANLRARAADEASSEAEAAAAAQRAAKLMAQHEITEAELRATGHSDVIGGRYHAGRVTQHPAIKYAAPGITQLSECRILTLGGEFKPFGLPADVEFALYLFELVYGASRRAFKAYSKGRTFKDPSTARKSFLIGFGHGVSVKFIHAADERRAQRAAQGSTGTALVIVKNEIIDAFIANAFDKVKPPPQQRKMKTNYYALSQGYTAGRDTNHERPLEQQSTTEAYL